jgi:hypothetical protein
MPTLDWIGKKAVLDHHKQVGFYLLIGFVEVAVKGEEFPVVKSIIRCCLRAMLLKNRRLGLFCPTFIDRIRRKDIVAA